MTIRVLLTLGLLATVCYALSQRARSRGIAAAMVGIALLGIYFVWLPEQANDLAHLLGVGRGADLVLYCWIVTSLIVALNQHLVSRANLRLITGLAREMALARPLVPPEAPDRAPPERRDFAAAAEQRPAPAGRP